MKPIDILSALPPWSGASPETVIASPAWAMPCRLGDKQCVMRLDAIHPADTLPLSVLFENERHVLGLADSPAFPELHAVWNARADIPAPILLALAEKDCGLFFQMLENVVRRQLKVEGVAQDQTGSGGQTAFCRVSSDDADMFSFTLDLSPTIVEAFGQLRNIDAAHSSVRDAVLDADAEYAAFALSENELGALSPGDALLLPEIGTLTPRIVADGRFALSESGLAPWKDDGLIRVCAAIPSGIVLGALFDAIEGNIPPMPPVPQGNAQLRLVRHGKTISSGRLTFLAGHPAFTPDS